MSRRREDHNKKNISDGSAVPPPSVPSINRRSNSFQQNDDNSAALLLANAKQQVHVATDEFGFPITQHLTQTTDLQQVSRPSRLNRSGSGQSAKNTAMPKQDNTTRPANIISRNHSSSSSTNTSGIQRVSSKISTSSSNKRPPRSSNMSYTRQNSHPSTTTSTTNNNNRRSKQPRIKLSKPNPQRYNKYTFQHPVNVPRVSIRTVDISNRIAFDTRIPPSCNSVTLQKMLNDMDKVRGSRSTVGSIIDDKSSTSGGKSSNSKKDNPCRISPSPNHMKLLEFMHGGETHSAAGSGSSSKRSMNRIIRQLQWNPAASADADPWFNGTYYKEGEDNKQSTKRRKPKSSHGDGRYIPIDPLSTTKSMIPNHSPILTNKKRRLPMRSDVGFANPTQEEVALKMAEVKKEAEWEEASPRIVLLASAFSLFQANEEDDDNDEVDEMDELHPSCQSDVKLWSGGFIPGIPFAGRDLVTAYKMNRRFDNEQIHGTQQEKDTENQIITDIKQCKNPRSYSVFAPPVDSTFSSSNLWRPRPFMDRPPGVVYFLACPLDVQFDGGDTEPLFCTMSLYCLQRESTEPQNVDHERNNNFNGKISEDFYFPAGDWSNNDDQQQQSWRRRKRRAIFSYDPLEVSPNDLHLVIEVHRVKPQNESDQQQQASGSQSKKTIGGKLKKSLLKGKSKERGMTQQMQSCSISNDMSSFEEVGAQHLMPVCFSITPAFASSERSQQKHESSTFLSFPDMPESQEDFIERLVSLVNPLSLSASNIKSTPVCGYTDVFTSYLGRDFTTAILNDPPRLNNKVSLDDNTASLEPQLLADVMGDCAISFDGPSASSSVGGNKKKNQRSNLRRLPPDGKSGYSSSFDVKEVLYFPPRSLPRKYEDDTALCSSTILNLLYVYPRLIRWKNDSTQRRIDGEYLSIRIRVVEQELPSGQQSFDSAEPTYQSLQAIYNPSSSPAGPPLVESLFTKLVKSQVDGKDNKKKTNRREVPVKDEVKVRLPGILDRRHFLQFSLFSIGGNGEGSDLIAETTIPFIISSKESASGVRVTTIIPNGLHRIQLSEGIQIHLETRLASSTHISDPSVATLLRDYSLVSTTAGVAKSSGGNTSDSASSASDIIVHPSSGYQLLDVIVMASSQAVKRHFSSLLSANMINFVNNECPSFYFESLVGMFGNSSAWHRLAALDKTDTLIAIVRSIFEILDKTRTSYQERASAMLSLPYQRLIKSFLDTFDESFFSFNHSDTGSIQYSENGGDSISERHFNESVESGSNGFNNDEDAYYDGIEGSMDGSKDTRKRKPKYTITSPRSSINTKSFTRQAFVATRSEQIKAEAEINDDDVYGREYFDDDQTVVTLGTVTSRLDSGSVFPVILESKSFNTVGSQDEIIRSKSSTYSIQEETTSDWTCGSSSGIVTAATPKRRSSTTSQSKNSTPFSFASKRAEYMANRVNTMAQLVIAPCIAPSVNEMVSSSNEKKSPRSKGHTRITSQTSRSSTNQSPFEPSSDIEEEGVTKNIPPYLRGNQSCLKIPPIIFTLMNGASMNREQSTTVSPHLYEVIVSLWVHSWTTFASSVKSSSQVQGTSTIISNWPYELIQENCNSTNHAIVAFSFVRNMSFFLPLCLKSIGIRCAQNSTTKLIVPMTFLDDNHIQVLVAMVETIGLGLIREAMSGSSGSANSDQMLIKALVNSDYMLDFIIGLFSLVHPSQVAALLLAYFNILVECEEPIDKRGVGDDSSLRRSKCTRQIRLHAVERLAVMPSIAKLNYPLKFTGSYPKVKTTSSSWANQSKADEEVTPKDWLETVDRYPKAFWLSELLMEQCLDVCSSSCNMIIEEAKRQAKATKQGSRRGDSDLMRDDLLRIESLAFHSITCAYELLIKRQSMDSRFQTVTLSTRVAALFTRSVLKQSVGAVSILSRMDSDQKVRHIWLLCLLYILQEGPDAMIRHELRGFCNPKDNRINDFVHLLKLASSTCQHYIPSNAASSFSVIGGLSNEMTQEFFNTLSASVILLIDECFDVVSTDEYELEKFGASLFDVLLHLLATPQSSVTLLRTLGGSAHALDKFGARLFLKGVGDQLQHWGRIILTMMNSTELSVRSMAVDFVVSLLCDIYREYGSIESTSLCFLTVLPEVVAREIALCDMSGLINSMKDIESSLWPLRRALADVEETDPLDDDRVDPQLLPSLMTLCRSGQAIIDGVLIEIRLRGAIDLSLNAIGISRRTSPSTDFRQFQQSLSPSAIFDADEESILEAATFFSHETSLLQKLRWLYTLTDLHVAKEQWSEVVEILILCTHSLLKSLDHVSNLWQSSRFDLWNDVRRSPWLSSIGGESGEGSHSVMEFANAFLKPDVFIQQRDQGNGQQQLLSVEIICSTIITMIDQIAIAFDEEHGDTIEELAYTHFEELLTIVTSTINTERKVYHSETRSALRRVRSNICSQLVKFSEKEQVGEGSSAQIYVQVVLHGCKPNRFKESTAIPTFLEWNTPSIVRIPKPTLVSAAHLKQQNPTESWEECTCRTYAKPLIEALKAEDFNNTIVLRTRGSQDPGTNETTTYISTTIVQKKSSNSRKFFLRYGQDNITEYTCAVCFPHALSRQRTLITSDIKLAG